MTQLLELRMVHLEMERKDLDLVILAKIASALHATPMTVSTNRKEQTERKHRRSDYMHEGQKICRDTFMFIHAVFKDRLFALVKHYELNGMRPRIHGNVGKQPVHALSPDDCQAVIDFVKNFVEINAVLLPGRIPGYNRDDLKLLPSSVAKAEVYRQYSLVCSTSGKHVIAKRTFYHLW